MCRLLAITNFEYATHRHIVDNFCQLAVNGVVMAGDPPGHGDGWGLAFYRGGELEVHKSGENLSLEKGVVIDILRELASAPLVILHLRKSAWHDSSSTRHAHPFHPHNVVFAHNGTVYDYRRLLPEITIAGLGEDALDTEVFMYHFLSAGLPDLGQAFLTSVSQIKRDFNYSALNCLFSDGNNLWAYRDYSKEPGYYSLYKAVSGNSRIVSSQPLDDDIQWHMMENEEFLEIPLD
jgi:predicted glutamine amidotransferase